MASEDGKCYGSAHLARQAPAVVSSRQGALVKSTSEQTSEEARGFPGRNLGQLSVLTCYRGWVMRRWRGQRSKAQRAVGGAWIHVQVCKECKAAGVQGVQVCKDCKRAGVRGIQGCEVWEAPHEGPWSQLLPGQR